MNSTSTKIIPKAYGYFLLLLGIFLSNVEGLPILLAPRADGKDNTEESKKNKKLIINFLRNIN